MKSIHARRFIPLVILGCLAFGRSAVGQVTGGPYQLYTVTPCRLVDTRSNLGANQFVSGAVQYVTVKSRCGIPSTARVAVLNVTVVSPSADGFITLWANGTPYPGTSMMNFRAGVPSLSNGAIAALGVGTPDIAVAYGTAAGGTTHLVIDIVGFYQ